VIEPRWHAASLAAVFLSLALGILLGSTALGGDGLARRQELAVRRIEADVAHLRQEEADNAALRQFAGEALPWIIGNRLRGRAVTLVVLGTPSAARDVISDLQLAQASVYLVAIPAGLAPAAADGWGQLAAAWSLRAVDHGAILERAADLLAASLPTGAVPELLLGTGAAIAEGTPRPPVAVVVLSGPDAPPDAPRRLVTDLAGLPTAVAAASGAARSSLIPPFASLGRATVDDVDQPAGRAALILALAGHPGRYGTGPGASHLLPPW